jgi:hypothetical protein
MILTEDIIKSWIKYGKELGALKLIITYDTFALEYKPRYVYLMSSLDNEIKYIKDLARITKIINIIGI